MGKPQPHPGPGPGAAPEAPEPRALSEYRAAVAAAIREEERDVAAIVAALGEPVAWSRWPERHRLLLMAAVTGEGEGMEAQKARALRRQLFQADDPGWPPVPPAALSPADCCAVERLRMALLGRTPLGCGRRLAGDQSGGRPAFEARSNSSISS
ncbi:MAG: hypothetical protein JNK31_03020 [Candidatus Competibacter sp.]|nr:hypothetical protein [Candidatus Competibacter sp.]